MQNDSGNSTAREASARAIDRRLPQTQCARCDYPGCLAYARALVAGEVGIDRCPPGGTVTAGALARLLNRAPVAMRDEPPPKVARIREADCIGCKLCIKACPVDCIAGAAKFMHSVIAKECSGCELCLPVCPTDCIEMIPRDENLQPQWHLGAPSSWRDYTRAQGEKWRLRAAQKRERELAQENEKSRAKFQKKRRALQREILAAVQRKQNNSAWRPA